MPKAGPGCGGRAARRVAAASSEKWHHSCVPQGSNAASKRFASGAGPPREPSRPKMQHGSNSQKAIKHRPPTPRPNAGLHHGSSRPRARAPLCRASPSRGSRPSRRSSRCGTTALWYRSWSRPWSGCWTRRRRSISSRSRRSSWRSPGSSRPRRARVSRALPLRSVFVSLAASRRRLDGWAGSLCANDSSLPPRTSRRAAWCLALRTVCADAICATRRNDCPTSNYS